MNSFFDKYLKNYFLKKEVILLLIIFLIPLSGYIIKIFYDPVKNSGQSNTNTLTETELSNKFKQEMERLIRDSIKVPEIKLAKDPISKKLKPNSININTADIETLSLLPGIGEKMAINIIDYRKLNGKFTKSEQLMNIKGIGQNKFDKLKDFIKIQ